MHHDNELILGIMEQQGKKGAVDALNSVSPEWFTLPPAKLVFEAQRALLARGRTINRTSILSIATFRPDDIEWLDSILEKQRDYGTMDLTKLASYIQRKHAKKQWDTVVARYREQDEIDSTEIEAATRELALLGIPLDGNRFEMQSTSSALETLKQGLPLLPPDKTRNLVTFGLAGLDNTLRCGPGSLGVISAITGAGKTTISIQMAAKTAAKGDRVLLVSMEMSHEEMKAKIIGHILKVDSFKILANTVKREFTKEQEEAVDRVKTICPSSGANWVKMEAHIRALHAENDFKCVVFDYFTLLEPPDFTKGANTAQRYGEISKSAKRLAQDLEISVILIAQFNRQATECEEPRLKDLRETGQLENDTNWALLMWNTKEQVNGNPVVKARIAKQRGGLGGFDSHPFHLETDRVTGNFYECQTEWRV